MTISLPISKPVAVVGAGAMGAGIAQVAALAGHPVLLMDARAGVAQQAINSIHAHWQKSVEKGKITTSIAQEATQRLKAVDTLSALHSAGLVIEAIVEQLEEKQKLFLELETIVDQHCIFASNTSSISITAIASVLLKKDRLVGMHFFNPAPVMPLVEIISGLATNPQYAKIVFATAEAWGKKAVVSACTPGFIVNRVARPYYGEALRLLQEKVADCSTIDAVMRESGGFRMGPFELMDLIGMDINFAVSQSVWRSYFYDQRFLPSLIQQEMVAGNYLGRKSQRGFYDYQNNENTDKQKQQAQTEVKQSLQSTVTLYGDSPLRVALSKRLKTLNINEQPEHLDGRVVELNPIGNHPTEKSVVIYLTDGRTATQRAYENQLQNIVVIDLALDYEKATRVALSSADACTSSSFYQAVALLQAAGFAVSRFHDVAGMAVMRTVAMLVNEGCDAVNQGVCEKSDLDTAMRLGVNYPLGPLSWADQLGINTIRTVLIHLGQNYGEDRYRISPLIHHHYYARKKFFD